VGLPERCESVVDKAIREAMERGEFDDLPGKGKPLPGLDGPDDDEWWVRDYIRREGLTTEDLLPESLLLRRQLERLDESVADLRTEQAVRDHVEELNRQVRRARVVSDGPPVVLRQAVADDVVARWRAGHPSPPAAEPAVASGTPAKRSWWRRTRRSESL
jgi:hypothetical protein